MKHLLASIVALLPTLLFAQSQKQVSFNQLSVEQGLSQNSVVSIAQDTIGYMWFATQDGLNKYGGRNFFYYQKFFEDITRENFSRLGKVYATANGKIYIITIEGHLESLDPSTGNFQRHYFPHKPSTFLQDDQGNSWLGTYGSGLYLVRNQQQDTVQVLQGGLENSTIYDQLVTADGLVVAGSGMVLMLNRNDLNYEDYAASTPKEINFSSVVSTEDNSFFIGTYGNGLYYKKPGEKLLPFEGFNPENKLPTNLNIQDLLIDRSRKLWIATYGEGAFRIDFTNEDIQHFTVRPFDTRSIHYNDVLCLYEDVAGLIWLGTDGGGLSYFDENLSKFNELTNAQIPEFANVDVARAISRSEDGRIWIGTSGKGLTSYDPTTSKFESFRTNGMNKFRLPSNRVMSLLSDDNSMWVGFQDGGLAKISSNRIKVFNSTSAPTLPAETVWCMLKDNKNKLWLGTRGNGLIQFDEAQGVTQHFTTTNSSLQSNNIRTIIKGRESTLWIGTEDKGLALFNQSSRDFIQYNDQAIAKIKSLYLDPPLLWIGTNGNGLQLLDTETNELRGFTTEDGLPNNVVYGVLPDKEGNLWLSSNRGLTKFRWSPEMEAPEITNYDSGDGLQAMEFNTGAYYASQEGTLYFGGLNGINWFKPNELGGNTTPPNTAIYEMEVFTETVPMTNGLKLPYDENTLSFSFSALHFSQPQNNMFKYRLTNYEEEWSRPSTVNTAHYPKLPAGSYVFEVVSSNNEDIWDESPATFSFTIKPVWYLTTIAKAGYVLLALLLFYFGYRYLKWRWKVKLQLEMEHEETERLRKLDELKSKLYTNISHEFRTPLTLISAPVQQLMESSGLKENDKRSLKVIEGSSKRMLRLVNQLLDLSKLERGSVQLQVGRHALKPQLLQLVEAFNLKAEQKGVLLNCQVDDFNDPYYDKDVVEKIVSNLLSNAIKYAPDDSTVEFSAEAKDGLLLLKTVNENYTLSESDIGRIFERFYQADKNSKGVGIGLALIKELALLSNGAVRAKKESPNSISFQVEIPIRRSYYNENSIVTPAEIIEFETFTSEENLETDEAIQLLVVEDNEEIRAYIASLFTDTFEVTQAADGLQGLEAALKVIPDLVISDIMMPNKDGIELCNELKSDQRTSHIPVVLLTAKSGGSNVLKGLKNKADDYIVKPFNAEVLRQKVINLINTRKQLRDRYSKNTFLQPKDIAFTPVDESFLETVQQIMNGHMTDPDFNAEKFAAGLAMSRMQLHRKIKALTSLSTTEFIRSQRLKAATKLLAESGLTINEVAYSVGFNTPSYFIKCFKETYGKTPSEYVKS